jgi:hypothetical protein
MKVTASGVLRLNILIRYDVVVAKTRGGSYGKLLWTQMLGGNDSLRSLTYEYY